MVAPAPPLKQLVIADDDAIARAFLTAKMEQRGFKVTAVTDGAAAIEAVVRINPDLVILDVLMPGLGGFETLRQLKASALTKHVPVVLLSAHHDVADVERAKSLGAADYIIKPFLSEDVVSHLRKLGTGS